MNAKRAGCAALLAVLAAGGAARADKPKAKASVVPPHITVPRTEPVAPPRCRDYLVTPADATRAELAWEQRLSYGACLERAAAAWRPIIDEPAQAARVIADAERLLAPALTSYRDVLADGPTLRVKLLAAYHLGAAYQDVIVRARIAIPPPDPQADATAWSANRALHDELEHALVPVRGDALAAFMTAASFAAQAPAIAHGDDVVRAAIARTRAGLGER
jgi:hypothetical protein